RSILMKRFLTATVLLLLTAATSSAQDIPLSKILVEGEGWHLVAKDRAQVTYLDGHKSGLVIYQGNPTAFLWPDGKTEDYRGPVTTRPPNHSISGIFQIDNAKKGLICNSKENPEVRLKDLVSPSCLISWPDEAQLVIGDAGGKYLWTARIEKDVKLGGPD